MECTSNLVLRAMCMGYVSKFACVCDLLDARVGVHVVAIAVIPRVESV